MLERLQAPARIGSHWTVEALCDTLRNLTQAYDAETLQVHELRSFINLCVSAIAEIGMSTTMLGYYGVHGEGVVDEIFPMSYIDLGVPSTVYTKLPLPVSVGGAEYTPDQPSNIHSMHRSHILHQTDSDLLDPHEGVFQFGELYDDGNGNVVDPEFYRKYFIPTAVIDDIHNVTAIFRESEVQTPRGDWQFALTKVSMDELSFNYTRTSALSQHGFWTYYGGRIYVYVGEGLLNTFYPAAETYEDAIKTLEFNIYAIRKPYLDNMLPVEQNDSGYFKHVDLPDKNIRLLTLMVQKMILEKLGRPITAELENIIAQGLMQLSGTAQGKNEMFAQQRLKTEQGFGTR